MSDRVMTVWTLRGVAVLVTALAWGTRAEAALYALYRFEDASGVVGATIADSTANGYDGQVFNADIGFVSRPLGGNAGDFSGGIGIVGADLPGVGTTLADFSIALWMKAANLDQFQKYLTDRHSPGQLSVIYEYVDDQVELFRAGVVGPDPRPGSQIAITDTDWHHIVYTRTGTDYDFYLDGVKTDIGTLTGDYSNLPEHLNIGAARISDSVNPFDGQLDDVAWFDNGLSAAQVSNIMSGNFSEFGVAGGFIPEPSTLLLAACGLLGLLGHRWRRRRK